jgi:D-alanine-D-alanine ligase-like ATP-grasp enzyme
MTSFYKIKTIDGTKQFTKITGCTLLILEEAEKCDIFWEKIKNTTLFKLEYKGVTKYFHGRIPSETTAFAQYACKNKRITRNLLETSELSIVKGFLVEYSSKSKYRSQLFNNLKKPLVIKPVDKSDGDNVFLNINSEYEYIDAIQKIYAFYGHNQVNILVEEMFTDSNEYRILATQKKVLSIIKRIPPNIVGNGKSTIKELVAVKNKNPIRLKVPTYSQISMNENIKEFLYNQNLTLNSVVEKEKQIFLLPHTSHDISDGGDTVNVTDYVHPSVNAIAMKIMDSIPGLSLGGIDYLTKDIYAKQTDANYRIIEVNSSPSLDWNQYPLQGPTRNIALEFLKIMFPNLD